ncbi:MAG: four helix bundle protein, partial [Candidatus Curtissbacteria bacterium]
MNSQKSENKIKSYQDLQVWQRSHKLALELYKLSRLKKKSFTDWEIWKQAMRASFSTPANIAEGFYSHRGKNFASHLEIARGSIGETDYWILTLGEISQISKEKA